MWDCHRVLSKFGQIKIAEPINPRRTLSLMPRIANVNKTRIFQDEVTGKKRRNVGRSSDEKHCIQSVCSFVRLSELDCMSAVQS